MELGDAVLVEWIDSAHATGWSDRTEAEDLRVVSVGILIVINRSRLTLALSADLSNGEVCGRMTIPRVAVTKTSVLKRAVAR